jgi:hypothetical protein
VAPGSRPGKEVQEKEGQQEALHPEEYDGGSLSSSRYACTQNEL